MNTNDIETQVKTLADRAFNSLRAFLTNTAKSNPTEPQLKALYALMDNMSRLVYGLMDGRYAWPLPVGCGKTTSACHFVAQIVKDRLPLSVAIASSQVSALNDINKFLVETLKVPQSLIGTLVGHDKASEVTGQLVFDGNECPILLVTHARIHMGADELPRYWKYQGEDRNLLIYDESLISSKSVIVDADEVSHAFYILSGLLRDRSIEVSAAFYTRLDVLIGEFHQTIKTIKTQIKTFRQQTPVTSVPVPSELRYKNMVLPLMAADDRFDADLQTIKDYSEWSKPLQAFFDLCGTTVRLVCNELGSAIVSFDITVPEHIANMVILDASSPIRLLVKLDKKTITLAEELPLVKAAGIDSLADLFDYSNVTWYVYRAGGGYKSFQNDKNNLRIKDAVTLVKERIPADEAVLFYVFKKRKATDKKDILDLLKRELVRQGFDLDSPLLRIETFGRETSLNTYSHCQHVIFVGTPWQNLNDLVATALGQGRDINKHLEDDLLNDLELSEVAYRYHQGAGRGSMRRNGPDGRPLKMTVYCYLQDHQRNSLMPLLKRVLPGMQTPEKRLRKNYQVETKVETVVEALEEYLTGLPAKAGHKPTVAGYFQVSLKIVYRGIRHLQASEDTREKAVNLLLRRHPEWSKQGRSLVYKLARRV